jgi:peptidoglycan/xylan/chitin deacetylase (PgdA/CDA1 family)
MGYMNRISNKINRLTIDTLFSFNLEQLFLSKKKGGVILCYHGVDTIGEKRFNMRFYNVESLRKQFIWLKKNTNVISVNDFFNKKNWINSKLNVAITFDDGYRNNFKYLKPLAEQLQIPISIYITGINNTKYNFLWPDFADLVLYHTNQKKFQLGQSSFNKNNLNQFVDENGHSLKQRIKMEGHWHYKEDFFKLFENEFNQLKLKSDLADYWQLMSDDEIRECSKSTWITIGSHGFFHNNLDRIPLADALNELNLSKSYLENLTQKDINELAYPDGAYSEELAEHAFLDLDFKYQLALTFHHSMDCHKNYLRSRLDMYPVYSDAYQLYKIIPTIQE